jgi:hypothetical protein
MGSQPEDTTPTKLGNTEDWKRLAGSLPAPPRAEDQDDLLWQELTVQFSWYDKAATRNRLAYQILKVTALAAPARLSQCSPRSPRQRR